MEKVAIITTNKAGWKTVRKRWETYLSARAEFDFEFFHLEDYGLRTTALMNRLGRLQSLSFMAAGREAVHTAVRAGCTKVVLVTIHYATFLPQYKGVTYFVYGDSTPKQLTALDYDNTGAGMPSIVERFFNVALTRLAKRGHVFLCSSNWNRLGVMEEYNVPKTQTALLPMAIDTTYWCPPEQKHLSDNIKVVFVGADFRRKGGELLLEVAGRPEFTECEWHIVTKSPVETSNPKVFYHTDFGSDDTGLLDLVRSSDIFVLPTYADCSPNVILEASACGLPVIATDVGGVADVVENDVTGKLISYPPTVDSVATAVLEYVQDVQLRSRHGEQGRQRILEVFDIHRTIDTLIQILQEKNPAH